MDHQAIPRTIISNLPCGMLFQYLLQTCLRVAQETNQQFGDLLNSSQFTCLWGLIYLVSNNLLSWSGLDWFLENAEETLAQQLTSRKMSAAVCTEFSEVLFEGQGQIFRIRQFLKALLSMKTISVKSFAENLLPSLILRQDGDMISHIFDHHGAGSIIIKWYIGLLEIDLQLSLGYFFKTDADPALFSRKYGSTVSGLDYISSIRRFLVDGIKKNLPFALTKEEAAALVACVIQNKITTLESMFILLPPSLTLAEVEEQYELLYGHSVLESKSPFNLQELLDSGGFRRNIHILAAEAVVQNDFEKSSVLLPYTQLQLSSEQSDFLRFGALSFGYGNVWDIIGKENFNILVREVEREALDPTCKRHFFRVQDLLTISFCLRSRELTVFLLDFFNTHSQKSGWGVGPILWESVLVYLHAQDLSRSCLQIVGGYGPTINDNDDQAMANWLQELLDSEFWINVWRYKTHLNPSLERLLHSAIWGLNRRQTQFLIRLGADINAQNSFDETPVVTALLWEKENGSLRTNAELRDEVDIFLQLLMEGADTGCLESFRTHIDDDEYQVEPTFLKAVEDKDSSQIVSLWGARFNLVSEVDNCPESDPDDPNPTYGSKPTIEEYILPTYAQACTANCPSRRVGDWRFGEGNINGFLLLFRDHVFELLRESFLQDSTDYERQQCTEHVELLLQESGRCGGEAFKFVIDRAFNQSSITLLQYLAAFGSTRLLESFFRYQPQEALGQISQTYPSSPSPLQLAAAQNNLDCVIFLIKNGANPQEIVCDCIWTVHLSNSRVVKHIGGRITPLHYAVRHGNIEMGQYLVEHSADIYARQLSVYQEGWGLSIKPHHHHLPEGSDLSVLELAVKLGRIDFVALFLSVDINARGQALKTALESRQTQIATFIRETWGGTPPTLLLEGTEAPKSEEKNISERNEHRGRRDD
ncbi:hypothetical protein TWF281_001558 [Arthrobotrys megalospora]